MRNDVAAGLDRRLRNLDYLFNPRSVAFIGATETARKWGFIVFNNFLMGGYEGKIYPVNPSRQSVMGHPAYPTVRDIPDQVDLAVFTIPARQVPDAIDDCGAKGVKAALVISAGFKELGGDSAELEKEMVRRARRAGMVLVGPNGQGMSCPKSRLFPWMPLLYPPPGSISMVSQSGNILNMMIGEVYRCGQGVCKAVSSGNEADIRMEDYFSYLAEDPETQVILSYVEGSLDGRRFFEVAREVSARKPIVLMKGGRTSSGMAAARSHTGAMAVSDELFSKACRQAGVIRAHTVEEAGVLAASFLHRPLPRGRRVGIITGGGGLGVIASDVCTDEGLEVARLSPRVLEELGRHLPEWWVPGNPVDLVAGLDFSVILPITRTLMSSGEVDSIMFIFVASPRDPGVRTPPFANRGLDLREIWDQVNLQLLSHMTELYELMRELRIPFYVVSNLSRKEITGEEPEPGDPNNLAAFSSVEMGCRAIAEMASYHEMLARRGLTEDALATELEEAAEGQIAPEGLLK